MILPARTTAPRRARRAADGRRAAPRAAALVAVSALVLSLFGLVAPAAPAEAASMSPSAVTVSWAPTNDTALQALQPAGRPAAEDGSGHFTDFQNLSVTVSKTQDLGDEVITISATGMKPTTQPSLASPLPTNYLQVMQCWGDDPNDPNFWMNCQYGARANESTVAASVGDSAFDAATRGTHPGDIFSPNPTGGQSPVVTSRTPNVFRTVAGDESSAHAVPVDEDKTVYQVSNGLENYFSALNSNEQPYVPFDASERAEVAFETQSSAAQPYLGCGEQSTRCWLVIVPRGTHSGELQAQNPDFGACNNAPGSFPAPYGATVGGQIGSPVSPGCAHFGNRIVVPLDFAPTGGSCAAGAETALAGSEFVSAAITQWQSAVCADGGPAFALTTASSDVTRGQIFTAGTGFAIVGDEVTPESSGAAEATIADARLQYAPVVNSSLTFGFLVTSGGVTHRELKLTPRLIAKFITQTYSYDIPWVSTYWDDTANSPSRADRSAPLCIFKDEEWLALGNPQMSCAGTNAMLVTPGPATDDAIRVLWSYLQADADAKAFLEGQPDPWGTTINPYYLPAGIGIGSAEANLATDRITRFHRLDQTLAPSAATAESSTNNQRVSSDTYMPYAQNFHQAAQRVFRGNNASQFTWSVNAPSVDGKGNWVKSEGAIPGSERHTFGATTGSDAIQYGLDVAQLPAPLATLTGKEDVGSARTFATYGQDTIDAAAQVATVAANGHSEIPLAAIPAGAYPLTFVQNAVAGRCAPTLTDSLRGAYAALLGHAAGAGQVRGDAHGQLPPGYAPLTEAQKASTAQLAADIMTCPATTETAAAPGSGASGGSGTTTSLGSGSSSGMGSGAGAGSGAAADAAGDAQAQQAAARSSGVQTSEATPSLAGQWILGLALLAGAAGASMSPLLLRRKGIG